jgi:hypothetical protein
MIPGQDPSARPEHNELEAPPCHSTFPESSKWVFGTKGVRLALAGTALVAAVLRFGALGAQSFWYDEAVTAVLARGALTDLASGRVRDLGNPPLLPILLHGWSRLFGQSDAALRSLSALAGVLCVPVLFSVGRRVAGEKAGLLAAALLAVDPFQVALGQEARVFALATLLALLTVETLQRALERPGSLGAWGAYGVSAFALAYAHYYGFFLLLGEAAFVASRNRRALLRQACALAAAGLAYATWLPAFLQQLGTQGNLARSPESWWMHALATPMVYAVGTTLAWKDTATPPRLCLAAAGAIACLVPVFAGLRATRRAPSAGLVRAWLAAPIVLPLAISLVSPIYQVRYAALATPAFLLLAAAGLLSMGPRSRTACAAVFVTAASFSLASWYGGTVKHDWRSAVAYVESRARRDDLVLFDADFNETAYGRYAKGAQPRLRLISPPAGAALGTLHGATAAGAPVLDVTARVLSSPRVWVVLSDARPESRRSLGRFFALGWRASARARYVGIEVELLERMGDSLRREAHAP